MSWLRIDDKFPEHERIISLENANAKWLHVVALCQCAAHLTDGVLDDFRLKIVLAIAQIRGPKTAISQLVDAGLWEPFGDGYRIRDYLDYNPSSAEIKAKRAQNATRVRKHRDVSNTIGNALQTPLVTVPQTQSPVTAQERTTKSRLLDQDREIACERLLERIKGGDEGTPRVVARFCKRLPKDRIDRVTATLRVGVKPAIAVAALKREVQAYEREVAREGAI